IGRIDAVRILDVSFFIKSRHQTKCTAIQTVIVIRIKFILYFLFIGPSLVIQTCTRVLVSESKFGTAARIVAPTVDTMLAICTVPRRRAVISDIIVIERYIIVVVARCLISYKTDDGSVLNVDGISVACFVRVVSKVQFGRADDAFVYIPVSFICARSILSILKYPDLVSCVIAVVTEDIHIRQTRRVEVVIFV